MSPEAAGDVYSTPMKDWQRFSPLTTQRVPSVSPQTLLVFTLIDRDGRREGMRRAILPSAVLIVRKPPVAGPESSHGVLPSTDPDGEACSFVHEPSTT